MTILVGSAASQIQGEPVVRAVADVCTDLLAPTASASDQHGLSRAHLDALAITGAFGIQFPKEFGGLDASATTLREVIELISGACGTTWFCFAQHKTPVGLLLASDNAVLRERWLTEMISGNAIGAAAFAHLRRPQQSFGMTRVPGGWRLDGKLDWVTTWPLCEVAAVQGFTGDRGIGTHVVTVFISPPRPDPSHAPGLRAGPDLATFAMAGTHTWPVRFDGYFVADEDVGSIVPTHVWRVGNERISADANPASFGMARAAINELAQRADLMADQPAATAAMLLAEELTRCREQAYELADLAASDAAVAEASIGERVHLRGRALDINLRAACALVTASGGSAMLRSATPGRRAREALFLQVQGQTATLRSESLGLLSQPRTDP